MGVEGRGSGERGFALEQQEQITARIKLTEPEHIMSY